MAPMAGLGNLPEKLGTFAADFVAYWLSLPKSEGVPMKHALDPGAMRTFVANVVMLERHDPRRFTWRLMGSAMREITGRELTGMDAFIFHDDAQREKAIVAYNAQLDTPCGVWGITMLRSATGANIAAETMALPFRADNGAPRFLVTTVEPHPDRARFKRAALSMRFLSWPEHRFVDIGFGLPRLGRFETA
jgi:hypothetical protein